MTKSILIKVAIFASGAGWLSCSKESVRIHPSRSGGLTERCLYLRMTQR